MENRRRVPVGGYFNYRTSTDPLLRTQLQAPGERAWILRWNEAHGGDASPKGPFYLYGTEREQPEVRAQQGYLVKMPRAFVERWPQLAKLADDLAIKQADLENQVTYTPSTALGTHNSGFNPKSDSDYIAMVRGGAQRRSRSHERLVRECGEALRTAGAEVSTPHPVDLLITSPLSVIVEAKTVGSGPVGHAIRQAVGQLHEYRYFIGPRDAALCVLVDQDPGHELQAYVEEELALLLLWCGVTGLRAGPRSAHQLAEAGLTL